MSVLAPVSVVQEHLYISPLEVPTADTSALCSKHQTRGFSVTRTQPSCQQTGHQVLRRSFTRPLMVVFVST